MNRDTVLWGALLLPPVIWFLSMETNFALAPWACAFGWKFAMFVVSGISFALNAGLALAAWSQWKSLGQNWPGDEGGAIPRAGIMAILGMMIAGMACLVTLAQAVPEIMMGACQ